MTDLIIPCVICFILVFGLIKKVNIFDTFIAGARKGLDSGIKILPALIILMTSVSMFKASGGLDILSGILANLLSFLHIPKEVYPLFLIRPVSGSGALVMYESILSSCGADSLQGRIASVLMGSSETTFYATAVYFGAVRIKNTRQTIIASITGDITAFILSSIVIYLFFY